MSLLTIEEMRDILTAIDPETKRLPPGFRAFGNAIESALLSKLAAGVSVEPDAYIAEYKIAYTEETLNTAIAAARVQGEQDAIKRLSEGVSVEPVAHDKVIKHIETAIVEHCQGGDLWTCAMLAAKRVDKFYGATIAAARVQALYDASAVCDEMHKFQGHSSQRPWPGDCANAIRALIGGQQT